MSSLAHFLILRRSFLAVCLAFAAAGLLPTSLAAAGGVAYPPEAYDDNRVVRVFDPNVSNFDFAPGNVYWKSINHDVLARMLAKALLEISGENTERDAWKKILAGATEADLSSKKVAVKINFNNTIRDTDTTLNNSPAMLVVLTKSLLRAGLKQEKITFFDISKPFPDSLKQEIRKHQLGEVVLVGKADSPAVSEKTVLLTDNQGVLRNGKPRDQYPIPQLLLEADYFVNLHLVKFHDPGVTGAMKNLFGIAGNVGAFMHLDGVKSFAVGSQLADLSLNEEIKKRARLNIAEFVFGGHTPDSVDKFTNEAFFPSGRPSSLIVSRSPFYHDTVLLGFVRAEYQTCVPFLERFKEIGPDTWLKNASAKYPAWHYDQVRFTDTSGPDLPRRDLAFEHVNYSTVR